MELILWRHAEAEDGAPDMQRALTRKGEKQARRVARWLNGHLPESARILASPALRAQQTAQALAALSSRKLKIVEALAPGAEVDDVLRAAGWSKARNAVVIVGHQPVLGRVASALVSGTQADWSIRKAGVWWLSSRRRGGEVVVRAVVDPDLL